MRHLSRVQSALLQVLNLLKWQFWHAMMQAHLPLASALMRLQVGGSGCAQGSLGSGGGPRP